MCRTLLLNCLIVYLDIDNLKLNNLSFVQEFEIIENRDVEANFSGIAKNNP